MLPDSRTRRFVDGGIQSTGNYPGKARNATELRADLEQALRPDPVPKTAEPTPFTFESDTPVARDQIKPEHFKKLGGVGESEPAGAGFQPPPAFIH